MVEENVAKKSSKVRPEVSVGKPLQTLSYTKKDDEWRKQNVEYFIRTASTNLDGKGFAQANQYLYDEIGTMQDWYDAYNNKIRNDLFNYVVNPLSATNELYKKFPAKLRSLNILRPTIDLLIGEYSKRPFKYDVVNLDGDGVMNSFLDAKYQQFKKNLTDRLVTEIEQATGQPVTKDKLPDPATVVDDFNSNYKDLVASKGYKALKLIESDCKLKEQFRDLFKDWCIAGQPVTMKGVSKSLIVYDRVSPKWVSVNKAPTTKNFEDGSDAVVKFRLTVADLVDIFYEELKEAHLIELEKDEDTYRRGLFNFFAVGGNQDEGIAKIDLFYVTWKSRKKIGFLKYNDPFTGEPLTTEVDEMYQVDKEKGEEVEWEWVNEVWHGWRVNDDLYIGIEPLPIQRSEANNFSTCKLPINGRRFSETESHNISIMSLGMPYQIMYIIMNYRIELTIAKSKGKILLLDKNTISDDEEHSEEKTFYYAEALGYMLLDRNQDGVDRAWNQYSVQDMSLFNHIEQLIKIAQYYKDSWEEMMGITRQRKGENSSSDGLGVTQEAVFRSTIISELIFQGFDEFIESELQGLLDLSKFAWIEGKKGYYRNDDGRMELLNIDPEEHAVADLGVFVQVQSQLQDKLNLLRGQINAIAQRKDVKLSTIADLIYTDSYAELREKLKKAEAIELQIAQEQAQDEQERAKELEEVKKNYLAYENFLEIQKQNAEWDRRDNNEIIKGEIQGRVAKAPSGFDIDTSSLLEESGKRLDSMNKLSVERQKIASNEKIAKMKDETEQRKIAASLKNKVVGEK